MAKAVLNEKFIASVRNLSKSFVEVLENWDDEHDCSDVHDLYPFGNAEFTQLVSDVLSWRDACEGEFDEEKGSAAKLGNSGSPLKIDYGVWTPWASVICYDCETSGKFRKPIAQLLEEGYALTTCDHCKKMIQISEEIANEHNLVIALRDAGLDAQMAQTGGMCSAVTLELKNGHTFYFKEDEDERNMWWLTENDELGEWLENSTASTHTGFKSEQEVIDYLLANEQIAKLNPPETILKLGKEMIEIPIERNGTIHLGRENILRMKAMVDASKEYAEEPDPVENLKAMKVALEEHVLRFLDDQAETGDYSDLFDLKITIGDKTFNLPLGAELTENFKKMIQAEIDDLNGI